MMDVNYNFRFLANMERLIESTNDENVDSASGRLIHTFVDVAVSSFVMKKIATGMHAISLNGLWNGDTDRCSRTMFVAHHGRKRGLVQEKLLEAELYAMGDWTVL